MGRGVGVQKGLDKAGDGRVRTSVLLLAMAWEPSLHMDGHVLAGAW